MNNGLFRLVFNRERGAWMAAAEFVRGHGKGTCKARSVRRRVAFALLAAAALDAVAAPRLPAGTVPIPVNAGGAGFVSRGTASYAAPVPTGTGNALTITQISQKAVLNWNSFNLAAGSSVSFSHPNSSAATLNKIGGADPSVIQGVITSTARDTGGVGGAVYLINSNGILFDRGAQVNVGGLVASALSIDDDRFEKGLYSTVDGSASFVWDGDRTAFSNSFVQVAPGAEIRTPDGGIVMLFAPRVINEGRIDTTNGQAILAAGAKVYLAPSSDLRLRGLLVEVDPFDPTGTPLGGSVLNRKAGAAEIAADREELLARLRDNGVLSTGATAAQADALIAQRIGDIVARTGNATLIGHAINQEGRISATTSVASNGSIYLLARDTTKAVDNASAGTIDRFATRTGNLVLGTGSLTEVQPDAAATTTSIDAQDFNPSEIALMGHKIHLQGTAAIVAPAGKVTVEAVLDPSNKRHSGSTSLAYRNDSRIVLDSGSRIDVSGLRDVAIDMSRNTVTAELFGSELRDSPLQRNGILYRKKIKYDLRKSSRLADGSGYSIKLADTSGYEAQIGRTVAERSAVGGSVALKSEGDVVVRKGATIDVSGGWLRYGDGYVSTTRLISGGRAYDVVDAPADLVYDSYRVIDNVYSAGYTEGRDAGKVEIVARGLVLDGALSGTTHVGRDQRDPAGKYVPPKGGQLLLGDATGSGDSTQPDYHLPDVVFAGSTPDLPAGFDSDPLNAFLGDRADLVTLTAQPTAAGFNRIEVYSNGRISQSVALDLQGITPKVDADGNKLATFRLVGHEIEINADFHAPGAAIELSAKTTAGGDGPSGSGIRVAEGVTISAAGEWTNDTSASAGGAAWRDSGNLIFSSASALRLGTGSLLDVSAGAWRASNGKLKYGKAGKIDFQTNVGTGASGTAVLSLEGELKGYGFEKGGSLALTAPRVTIADTASAGTWLTSAFFSTGGFGSYTATGIGGLDVAPLLTIAPIAKSLVMGGGYARTASGTPIDAVTDPVELGFEQRKPIDITLAAVSGGGQRGVLKVGDGATVRTEAGGKLTLKASEALYVGGTLDAPGGSITLQLTRKAPEAAADLADLAGRSLWLGASAELLARGVLKPELSTNGRRLGSVIAGGSVTLSTEMGYIVGESGSLIDVSGKQAVLDLKQQNGAYATVMPTLVAGNAGSIAIDSRDGILLDATLAAQAGGAGAAAGSLSVKLDRRSDTFADDLRNAYPTQTLELALTQNGNAVPVGLHFGDAIDGSAHNGKAPLSAARIAAGGFDDVTLAAEHRIAIEAGTTLATRRSLKLDAPALAVRNAGLASLESAWVQLGNSNPLRQSYSTQVGHASAGSGTLDVIGRELLDLVGTLRLQGIGVTTLGKKATADAPAVGGEVRLQGVSADSGAGLPTGGLILGGTLDIIATQSYPTTLSSYSIEKAPDPIDPAEPGTTLAVNFFRVGDDLPATPLSAGGSLTVSADSITHDGVLRAPLGAITLDANSVSLGQHSVTSASAGGLTIPYGVAENGSDWLFPLPANSAGNDRSTAITIPPEKRIKLKGATVDVAADATIDLSGGGDLYAYEFLPGLGGSTDYLGKSGVYAILPDYSAKFAPVDPLYSLGSTLVPGSQITLGAGGGLAAGTYTLLPGHYALLPGAYVVTQLSGYRDMVSADSRTLADGSAIVAGRFTAAGSGASDARSSGFLVESATVARTKAQYVDYSGDAFFSAQTKREGTTTPRLASDAGRLVLSAATSLQVNGNLLFAHLATARGGELDIVAPKLAVTGNAAARAAAETDGYLALDATKLNSYGAESLVLGAERVQSGGGRTLVVGTTDVRIDTREADAEAADLLKLPEFIAAASNTLEMREDSRIVSSGTVTGASDYTVTGPGALLRVASAEGFRITRNGASNASGTLDVAANAQLGGGAVELDATKDTKVSTVARIAATSLSIASSAVRFDETPPEPTASGLTVNSDLLARIQTARELRLRSYGSIDFAGSYTVGQLADNGEPLLRNLTLDTRAIRGLGGAGAKAKILAASVTLTNTTGVDPVAASLTGGGSLKFEALAVAGDAGSGRITIGPGKIATEGFGAVALDAAREVAGAGVGTFTTGGAGTQLDITAGRVTAATRAVTTIQSDGAVNIAAKADAAPLAPVDGLGAVLTIKGTAVEQGGVVDIAAGNIALQATTGDLVLAAGSLTRAGAYEKSFDETTAYSNAGAVKLAADAGNVMVKAATAKKAAASIDVSAHAGGGDAGSLTISAAKGSLELEGTVSGNTGAGGLGGRFDADVKSMPKNADDQVLLDGAASRLKAGGFDSMQNFRIREGNVKLSAGNEIKAGKVGVSVDAGSFDIAGSIDASGGKGGQVGLFASDNLSLNGSIDAHATGAGTRGGLVTLGSTSGNVTLNTGSTVNVGGGTGGRNGEVLLRAKRTGAEAGTGVAVTSVAGNIVNAESVAIEAVKTYTGTTVNTGNSSDTTVGMATVASDVTNFMSAANVEAIKTALYGAVANAPANFHVRPGVEITSTGDLTLSADWNLYSASRSGGEPGYLTLRATGNLNLNKSLSDGFTTALTTGVHAAGSSWSYRLVGGAATSITTPGDTTAGAADPMRVVANLGDTGTGDINVAAATRIRTGSGSIDLAAGRDIKLAADTSVIYTAGAPVTVTSFYTPDGFKTRSGQSQTFGDGGGNISLAASRDLTGVADSQLITSWLYRQGNFTVDQFGNAKPENGFLDGYATAWWSRYDLFRQDIGALGGGDVSLAAGRDIRNVSAMLPTSGRMATRNADGSINLMPDNARLTVTGSGDLDIRAGGNIHGGQYLVMKGDGALSAGGSLLLGGRPTGASASNDNSLWYPILAAADGRFRVSAVGDVNLDAVVNPTVIPQHKNNATDETKAHASYFTYSSSAAVALTSLTGNVSLWGGTRPGGTSNNIELALRTSLAVNDRLPNKSNYEALRVWAPSLTVASFDGDIQVPGQPTLYPTARGSLSLLAASDVMISGRLAMADVDPSTLPRTNLPYNDNAFKPYDNLLGDQTRPAHHAIFLLHEGDETPVRVVAAEGDVIGNQATTLVLAKPGQISAGRDIRDLGLVAQNLASDDATRVVAGRDIIYTPKRSATNALEINQADIQIAGPGRMDIIAGRDIDLGTSAGITSRGNLANPYLPDSGAGLRIVAGNAATLDTTIFVDRYLNAAAPTNHLAALNAYLLLVTGVTPADAPGAVAAFRALDAKAQTEFAHQVSTAEFSRRYLQAAGSAGAVADSRQAWTAFAARTGRDPSNPDWQALSEFSWQVLWPELRAAGQAASVTGVTPGDYARGLDALTTLGWAAPYRHDGVLSLIFSQIKTERGGTVELLVPGGNVNVGLATLPAGLKKESSELGIMTLKGGEILAMTQGDFQVNQSRVLSLAGGDIMIWSSEGNIDAGRGKKTSVVIPPPIVRVDKDGRFFVEYPGAASGSGIGALKTDPLAADSNVELFAPKGTVNAGDAGIRSSGRVTIAAQRVIGANNIAASGGPVVGVKVESAAAPPVLAASNAGADAAKASDQAAQAASNVVDRNTLSTSILTVEILGVGDDDERRNN
jgi:filamentous hemagglutinin family protein